MLERVSPLYAAMLDGAEVSVNSDGVLEITSGNLMLQGMTANGSQDLEQELEAGFGRKVHALVITTEQEETEEEKNSAVDELLEKARQLGIEVVIK